MEIKFEDNFDYVLLIDKKVIDAFTSTLREAFDRMHAESKKRGKDVELYYKNKDRHQYVFLSAERFYRGKDETNSSSISNN